MRVKKCTDREICSYQKALILCRQAYSCMEEYACRFGWFAYCWGNKSALFLTIQLKKRKRKKRSLLCMNKRPTKPSNPCHFSMGQTVYNWATWTAVYPDLACFLRPPGSECWSLANTNNRLKPYQIRLFHLIPLLHHHYPPPAAPD